MNKPQHPRHDALVRFQEDGPHGAQFIRYQDCLMSLAEFISLMEADGLPQEFLREYVNVLPSEVI